MSRLFTLIIALLLVLAAASTMLFVVDQRQTAIVFALGEVKRVVREPGLHWKLPPPLQNVMYFDRRTLTLDSPDIDRFITAEKLNIQVDSYVKWRIADAKAFFVSVGGSEKLAQDRISQQVRSALNNEIARLTIDEVVSVKRDQLVLSIRKTVADELIKIGLEIIDVRLKRVDFAPEVAERVYDRMASERKRVANERRATGAADKEKIQADADRQREVIMANGYRDAQVIMGAGDAKATAIFAEAYANDPDFAIFYRSLDAYRQSFNGNGKDLLVVDPKGEFFRHFNGRSDAARKPGARVPLSGSGEAGSQ